MKKKLGDYRDKRRPDATNEPFGDEGGGSLPAREGETLSGAYVVHLHAATRLHYDVRLEVGGVLASFAVPRGPSLDPEQKHLAVHTEDHPIEYLEFEDVIPEAQYGAGPMIMWDRGTVAYLEGPAERELEKGKLDLEFRGFKLRGRYAFVKLAKSEKGNEWLLFKKKDAYSDPDRDLLEEQPRSVLSGLRIDEIADAEALGAQLVSAAKKKGATRLAAKKAAELLSPERSPLAAAGASEAPRVAGKGWLFDAELDGVRVLASRDGDTVSLRRFDAKGEAQAIETFYPEVVRALRSLMVRRVVLEGSLVLFDESGRPNLSLLAKRVERIRKGSTDAADVFRAVTGSPVVLLATDVLLLDDADTRPLALEDRRSLLAKLLPEVGFVRTTAPLEGDVAHLLAMCRELEIEGVVAKKSGAAYGDTGAMLYVPSGVAPRSRTAIDHRAPDAKSALRRVTVSNRTKVFWPEEGYTKGDLVDYYANVADAILPFLHDRPVIVVRYPDGIDGKSFFQWNVPPGMPAWVRTMTFEDEGHLRKGFLVDDASTLQYLANLACIPLHILACHAPDLSGADFLTIDFDVKQSALRHAVTLAKTLHELLDEIGLVGFPKTSGQTGLHVLVPLGFDPESGPRQSFDTARALADLLGQLLVARHPDIATMERIVNKRGPKVYVDTGQTGASRAIVAPYSVRATKGATVSTPLTWEEVEPDLDPRAFTMKTVPGRLADVGDPMADLLTATPDVANAVAKLATLVPARRA